MMRRSLIVLLAVASLALTGTGVWADDFAPPWWRGKRIPDPEEDSSTYQRWEFETAVLQPIAEEGYVNPPIGPPPQAGIDPAGAWIGSHGGRTGIRPLSDSPTSGLIDLFIYNYSGGPEKKVWVQLTWMPLDPQDPDDVPDISAFGTVLNDPPLPPLLLTASREFMSHSDAGDGWFYTLALLMFEPNPDYETIRISGDILVDEVVVDTICPEPTTMLLLGLAAPFVLKRRGRR